MKIENKTNEEIRAHIVKMCDSYNKTGKDLYLKIKEECESELQRRAQKKSVEPSANQGQLEQPERRLPTKEELQAWEKGMESDNQSQHRDHETTAKVEHLNQAHQDYTGAINRLVVGRASEITVTIPVAEVKIAGEIRSLTQTEIIGLLKTYFKRVAISMAKEGQYTRSYASEMGKTVWRLFDGWNLIYRQTKEGSAWPPMDDVFPGWKHAQQAHKVTADMLWRWASNREE